MEAPNFFPVDGFFWEMFQNFCQLKKCCIGHFNNLSKRCLTQISEKCCFSEIGLGSQKIIFFKILKIFELQGYKTYYLNEIKRFYHKNWNSKFFEISTMIFHIQNVTERIWQQASLGSSNTKSASILIKQVLL